MAMTASANRESARADKPTPDLVLRGSRKDAAGQYETTVLLFRAPNAGYLTGWVLAAGNKHHVIAHINERKPDMTTGEVKPNFLVLSELVSKEGEEERWEELGHGNAMNRRSDNKAVYFDEMLFNVKGEILNARITQKVDQSLHRQLGFENPRVDRPDRPRQATGTRGSREGHTASAPASR